jgi:hypothetical protein
MEKATLSHGINVTPERQSEFAVPSNFQEATKIGLGTAPSFIFDYCVVKPKS